MVAGNEDGRQVSSANVWLMLAALELGSKVQGSQGEGFVAAFGEVWLKWIEWGGIESTVDESVMK